jgi:ABC-2 type transport system ATP-binding protein
MNRAKAFAVAAVFLFTILLGACQSSKHLNNAKNTPDYERIDKTHYTIQIHAHDGTKLKATVFQPELVPGEEAPLVIQTHGFGGFRMSGERSLWGKFVITGQAALEAWDQGYWVISYDQRGFGGSGGDVQMMHPDYEVQDLGAVIDWAYEHLPRLKLDDVGDPRVGVIGENYAAGLQVLASIFDHRIDAIVPVTSWYNLADAMAPNGLNKTAWGGVAGYMGTMSSGFDMGIMLKPEVRKSMGSKLADETKAFLAERSPQTYCEREEFPQADALLIQGFRDTMFSINHAVQNKLCIEQGGNEAKLIGVQDGNLLPSQKLFGFPFFHIDEKVNCGEHKFKTTDMIVRWFNEKLKDVRGAANKIPE